MKKRFLSLVLSAIAISLLFAQTAIAQTSNYIKTANDVYTASSNTQWTLVSREIETISDPRISTVTQTVYEVYNCYVQNDISDGFLEIELRGSFSYNANTGLITSSTNPTIKLLNRTSMGAYATIKIYPQVSYKRASDKRSITFSGNFGTLVTYKDAGSGIGTTVDCTPDHYLQMIAYPEVDFPDSSQWEG